MRMDNYAMRRLENKTTSGQMGVKTTPATYGGIITKSLIFGAVTIVATLVSYFLMANSILNLTEEMSGVLFFIAVGTAIPLFIVSLIIAFAPSTVKVLGFVYALLEGGLLGTIVMIVDFVLPGVPLAAVLGTLIVFVIAVVLNKLLEVKVSSKLMKGVIISFVSITLLAAVMGILAALGVVGFGTYWWLEIIVSAVCIVMATIMLLSDLQSADNIVAAGVDSSYEWNVSFAIVTTLVYLYIEILELLVRLAAVFGRNKN